MRWQVSSKNRKIHNMNGISEIHRLDIKEGNASHPKERDVDLFFQIADVLDFRPDDYDQACWGKFTPKDDDAAEFERMFGDDPWAGLGEDDPRWIQVKDCSTALCVAGHAAALNGYFPIFNHRHDELDWGTVSKDINKDRGTSVDIVARGLLGITELEGDALFSGDAHWNADDLRKFGKGADILNHVEASSFDGS